MSNGDQQQQNCALEICCGGDGGAKQREALVNLVLHDYPDADPAHVGMLVAWFVEHYDLAEKGTLLAFKDSIAKYARGFPYES